MSEDGYSPQGRPDQPGFRRTFVDGFRLVQARPVLVTLFGIAAFYQISGEVFLRLSVAHFLENVGLPGLWSLKPVIWFGMMRMASALASLATVQFARSRVPMDDQAKVSGWLLRINALQGVCLVVFALSGSFLLAFAAYLAATSLGRMFQPLYLSLLNAHVESNVRATVISMSSQVDALGQSLGAPILGVVASLASIRAALAGAALVLVPALALNARATTQQGGAAGLGSQAPASN